jgi:hypothetical protein
VRRKTSNRNGQFAPDLRLRTLPLGEYSTGSYKTEQGPQQPLVKNIHREYCAGQVTPGPSLCATPNHGNALGISGT